MPNLQPWDPSPSPSLRDRSRALKTQSMPMVPSIAALAAQQSSQTQHQPTSPTVSTNSNNRRSSPIGQVTRLLPYEASSSRKDVLNAYSLAAPVATLYDLLYYRYGFSLRELPYTGVPSSHLPQVCHSVGGQNFEEASESAVNRNAIADFLSILAGSQTSLRGSEGF